MVYAGRIMRTEQSEACIKTCNSCIRVDYNDGSGRGRRSYVPSYATVTAIFRHELYPGGPARTFVRGKWFDITGECATTGLTLLRENPENDFNLHSRFTHIEACFPRSLAFWPYDPFDTLDKDDPNKDCLVVIDRNQEESP